MWGWVERYFNKGRCFCILYFCISEIPKMEEERNCSDSETNSETETDSVSEAYHDSRCPSCKADLTAMGKKHNADLHVKKCTKSKLEPSPVPAKKEENSKNQHMKFFLCCSHPSPSQ